MATQNNDHLNFRNDPEIKAILCHEELLYSEKIIKKKTFFNDERNFVISNEAIYNMKKKEKKRKIEIEKLKGITIDKYSKEFIIHGGEGEYDYLIVSENRLKIIEIIESLYEEKTGNELKFVINDQRNLKNYVTKKKEKQKNSNLSKMDETKLVDIREFISSGGDVNITTRAPTSTEYAFSKTNKFRGETFDSFEIISVIGKGKGSTVYLAKFKDDGQYYALKVIEKIYIVNNQLFDEIELEKDILSCCGDCKFIAEMEFWFETESQIIFVIKYYNKGDLYHLLSIKKTLDETTTAFLAVEIAAMLKYLHSKDILYRDLKAENLVFGNDGFLYLIDFGTCKLLKKKDELSSSFCGSPEYVSPEMVSGKGYGKANDWWSFGVLLFEMLFGVSPFYDEYEERIFDLVTMSDLRFPTLNKKKISEDGKDLIRKVIILCNVLVIGKGPNEEARLSRSG